MPANTAILQIAIEVDTKDGIVSVRKVGDESEKAGQKGKKSFSGMGKSLDHFNKKAASATSTLMKLAGTVVSIYALQRAITALKNSMEQNIDAASRLNEVQSKFNVVFEGQRVEAEKWAKTLQESYAMSRRESKEYLSSIQDLLVPMGMQADMAGKLSFEIAKLSADLGSFNNLPTAQVMGDIQSALVGNYETMKKYGVVINATIVQEKALEMGLAATKDQLTAAHKAQAAYTLMVEDSQAAIGDMSRTSGEYANQLKQYRAIIEDVRVEFGEELLPTATEALTEINTKIKELKETGQLDVWANDMARFVLTSFQWMARGAGFLIKSIYAIRAAFGSVVAKYYETQIKALEDQNKRIEAQIAKGKKPLSERILNFGESYKEWEAKSKALMATNDALIKKYKELANAGKAQAEGEIKKIDELDKALGNLLGTLENFKAKINDTKTNQEIWKKELDKNLELFKKIDRQIKNISADAIPGYNAALKESITLTKELKKIIPDISGKELMEIPDVEPDMTQTEKFINAMDNFRTVERQKWQEYYDWKKKQEKETWKAQAEFSYEQLQRSKDIFSQIADAGGKHSKKAFAVYQAIALTQIAVDTATAIMGILGHHAWNPVASGALIGWVTGMAALQAGAVLAAEPAGYKGGGWVKGGSGTKDDVFAGSTKQGNAITKHWVMGGEFVVNKSAASRFGGLLELINENYASGGWIKHKGYGGLGIKWDPIQDIQNLFSPDVPEVEVDTAGQMFEELNETIRKLTSTLGDLAQQVDDIVHKYDEEIERAKELGVSIDLVTQARMAELDALAADISEDMQEIIDSLTLSSYQQEMNRLAEWYDDQLEAITALAAQGVDTTGMVADLTEAYALQAEEAAKAAIEMARQDLASAQDMQAMIRELSNPRSEWSINDFVAEFDRLTDQIGNLDETSETYLGDLLNLTREQVGILNHIEDLQQRTVESLRNSISSINDMVTSLRGGDLAPVQSMEFFQSRYETLLAGAGTEQGLADFQSFIPEYLEFMRSYGVDYAELVGAVTADLEGVQTIFETQLSAVESLLEDIESNTQDTTMELVGLAAANNSLLSNMDASIGSLVDVLTTAAEAEAAAAAEALAQAQAQAEAEAAAQAAQAEAAAAAEAAAIAAAEEAAAQAAAAQAAAEAAAAAAAEEEARQNVIRSIQRTLGFGRGRDWFEFHDSRAIERMTLSDLQDYLDNLIAQQQIVERGHQSGGLTTGLSFAGEIGPEWVVPTYEPQRSRFLRDVGADPDAIGAAVARHIIPLVTEGGKEIHIHLDVDGREIGHVVAQEFDRNSELIDSARRSLN